MQNGLLGRVGNGLIFIREVNELTNMVSRTLQRKTHRNQFDFWINWINAVVAVFALLFFVDRGKLFVFTIVLYKSGLEAIGTVSAKSVELDLGCTSKVYFDNVMLT